MSFQDTRTPQYPEMQKQKPYGWLRNHPQKPADSRHNTGITKKSGRTFITVWASRAGFEPAFRLDLLSLQPFKP